MLSFTECISNVNITQIDNENDIDVVISMYSLLEYNNNYSKTSGGLWLYYIGKSSDQIVSSKSFISKIKITGKTPAAGNTKYSEIVVPLKNLSNIWRSFEMPLINCEINFILTWSENCVNFSAMGETKSAMMDTKLYVPIATLSTQ